MKYALWLFYSLVVLAIVYVIPLLVVGEKVEVRTDYFNSFEGQTIEDFSALDNDKDALKLALVGVEVLQGAEGRQDWQLNADWLTYSGGSGNLLAKEPELVYFDKGKRQPFKATSDIGRVLENNTIVEMTDNVVLNQDTIRLSSPFLNFSTNDEIFTLSKGVRVQTPELLGRADNIKWDTKGNKIQANRNVVFIFNHKNSAYTLNSPVKKAPKPKNEVK